MYLDDRINKILKVSIIILIITLIVSIPIVSLENPEGKFQNILQDDTSTLYEECQILKNTLLKDLNISNSNLKFSSYEVQTKGPNAFYSRKYKDTIVDYSAEEYEEKYLINGNLNITNNTNYNVIIKDKNLEPKKELRMNIETYKDYSDGWNPESASGMGVVSGTYKNENDKKDRNNNENVINPYVGSDGIFKQEIRIKEKGLLESGKIDVSDVKIDLEIDAKRNKIEAVYIRKIDNIEINLTEKDFIECFLFDIDSKILENFINKNLVPINKILSIYVNKYVLDRLHLDM